MVSMYTISITYFRIKKIQLYMNNRKYGGKVCRKHKYEK